MYLLIISVYCLLVSSMIDMDFISCFQSFLDIIYLLAFIGWWYSVWRGLMGYLASLLTAMTAAYVMPFIAVAISYVTVMLIHIIIDVVLV